MTAVKWKDIVPISAGRLCLTPGRPDGSRKYGIWKRKPRRRDSRLQNRAFPASRLTLRPGKSLPMQVLAPDTKSRVCRTGRGMVSAWTYMNGEKCAEEQTSVRTRRG